MDSGTLRTPPDLEALRKRRGLTLQQIAVATKISVAYLQAIEEGRFERLPGGIYDISYIRQYARAIDYDESELLAWYRAVVPPPPDVPPLDPPPRKSAIQRFNGILLRGWI